MKFEIEGGNTLAGEIRPQGAKNEALQVLCAVLLTDEDVVLENVPNIIDVSYTIDILKDIGVEVIQQAPNTYLFRTKNIHLEYLDTEKFKQKASKIRGSVMLLGPLLARKGKACLPKPGGDKIGRRRLDTHFLAFEDLGIQVDITDDNTFYILQKTLGHKCKDATVCMEEISVTATANIIMFSVLSYGSTIKIYNVACEPYVQQLCRMLNSMGAKITGISSNLLTIQGVETLGGCRHRLLADMIEVGSFIGLAAMTRSEITIKQADVEHLGVIPKYFRKLGIHIEEKGNDLYIPKQKEYRVVDFMDGSILTIYDAPWPGFTPDLISIFLVVSINAIGSVLIHQKMFESRLFFVDKLIDMGAKIILCDPHRATVIGMGNQRLKGIKMSSPDIRSGVSLLIAALSAEGKSVISNINQIDRGYESIDTRLNTLGASIKRVDN